MGICHFFLWARVLSKRQYPLFRLCFSQTPKTRIIHPQKSQQQTVLKSHELKQQIFNLTQPWLKYLHDMIAYKYVTLCHFYNCKVRVSEFPMGLLIVFIAILRWNTYMYVWHIKLYYYTSDSLWKIWLVESIQSIRNSLWTWHDKCIICCRYCIYHVKFKVCLVTKPLTVFSSETKWLNASLLFLRMNYVKNV